MGKPKRRLTDDQRRVLGYVADRCMRLKELSVELESLGVTYPKAVEMGQEQALEAEIRDNIQDELMLILDDVVKALEWSIPPVFIIALRDHFIHPELLEYFPQLTVNGVTL